MRVETVTTADQSLLHRVRETLSDAPDALLCVAFVDLKGVHLIAEELEKRRARRTRLLVTTVFGSSEQEALTEATELGVTVKTFNPAGRTFHPKLYLGPTQAVIGSANLTGGLATNFEAGVFLEGRRGDAPIASAWSWAEALWNDQRALQWTPGSRAAEQRIEPIASDLLPVLETEIKRDPMFRTLASGKPNRVALAGADGLYVETERSRDRGQVELVPAWMLNLAWEYLKTHRELSNRTLLNDLRVHRSSAVCAILARHPAVEIVSRTPIRLRLK